MTETATSPVVHAAARRPSDGDAAAKLVRLSATADPRVAAASLAVEEPIPVLVLCGTDTPLGPARAASLADAVTAAAGATRAVVLHRGADPAFAALLEERGSTVVVAVDTDGSPRPLLGLAGALAGGLPVAALLVCDTEAAEAEAREAAAHGVPVIAAEVTGPPPRRPFARRHRPGESAVRAGVRVRLVDGADEAELTARLGHALTWALHPDVVLREAWLLYATYDHTAVRLRRTFARYQSSILGLGVIATALAVLHQDVGTAALHWAVVAASLVVGTLVALSGRRDAGKCWVLTRAAAEAVKSEIFRYRTRTPPYDDDKRARRLAGKLDHVQQRLMHTEASGRAAGVYRGPLPPDADRTGDDGLTRLDATSYLELRVADQLGYYRRRLADLERRGSVLQTVAIVAGGLGAVIAAAGAVTWVALTTALGAAPLSYLAHLQVERTIVVYNGCVARLEMQVRDWYGHLPDARSEAAFARLVEAIEHVLTAEHAAWMEHMTKAMRESEQRDGGGDASLRT